MEKFKKDVQALEEEAKKIFQDDPVLEVLIRSLLQKCMKALSSKI